MRKLAGVALLFAFFATLFLAIAFLPEASKPEAPEENAGGQLSLGIRSALIADSGGRSMTVLQLYLQPAGDGGRLYVVCSQQPMQKNMLILSHAAAPGVGKSLPEKIARQLSLCGFSSRRANSSDALESKNSVVISPTGALPSEFSSLAALSRQNSRLVLLQSLPGREIDEQGLLSFSESQGGFEAVPLEPTNEDEAAADAARAAIMPPGQAHEIPVRAGNFTAAVEAGNGTAYCRAVYLSQGACRFADTGPLERLQGTLSGAE